MEYRLGVFGLLNELVAKPCDKTFNGKPGEFAGESEQSMGPTLVAVAVVFATAAVQGGAHTCEAANGGLKPGLGLENGPFSCPP
jgi:hypothetical protein